MEIATHLSGAHTEMLHVPMSFVHSYDISHPQLLEKIVFRKDCFADFLEEIVEVCQASAPLPPLRLVRWLSREDDSAVLHALATRTCHALFSVVPTLRAKCLRKRFESMTMYY
jgi:hypothetical protein